MDCYIGVDIGGTDTKIGICDENYELLTADRLATDAKKGATDLCNRIFKCILSLCDKAGVPYEDVKSIGISAPGIIKNGCIKFASNLDFHDEPMVKIMSDLAGKPTFICNDANAAALSEAVLGCGKGHKSLVMVTVGTGIGGGIVFNNKIHEGFNGAGAELGHIIIVPGGRRCSCGNRGCFETYCSATALINDTKEAMLDHPDSALWQLSGGIENVGGKTVYDAMHSGDKTAIAVVNRFNKYFSIGLSNIITILQPEVLCIGGGMSEQETAMTDPITKLVYENGTLNMISEKTLITTAKFHNDAGIIGAVINSRSKLYDN